MNANMQLQAWPWDSMTDSLGFLAIASITSQSGDSRRVPSFVYTADPAWTTGQTSIWPILRLQDTKSCGTTNWGVVDQRSLGHIGTTRSSELPTKPRRSADVWAWVEYICGDTATEVPLRFRLSSATQMVSSALPSRAGTLAQHSGLRSYAALSLSYRLGHAWRLKQATRRVGSTTRNTEVVTRRHFSDLRVTPYNMAIATGNTKIMRAMAGSPRPSP